MFRRINTDSVYMRTDEGIPETVSCDGKHLFVLLTETPLDLASHGKVAVVHFGNPFVLEDFEHIPRVLIGTGSYDCTLCAIDVLAGKYPARGVMTYDVKLKEEHSLLTQSPHFPQPRLWKMWTTLCLKYALCGVSHRFFHNNV
ncbi:MAG: hypothetical protein IJ428_05175 [Clostridia bacterium]|nr:hypothetical protein [Clostridia bacterium]